MPAPPIHAHHLPYAGLLAARAPVVVNPKAKRVEMFRKVLPSGTPILNWGCKSRAGDPVA